MFILTYRHNVASKEDIAQAMETQSATSVVADLQTARGNELDPTQHSVKDVKLENMELSAEDLEELGEEKLKAELRARGKDFRGENVKQLASRLFRVLAMKKKMQRKGNSKHNRD